MEKMKTLCKIVATLVISLAILNSLDYILTLYCLHYHIAYELNPTMRYAFEHGLAGFIKITMSVFMVFLGVWIYNLEYKKEWSFFERAMTYTALGITATAVGGYIYVVLHNISIILSHII